MQPQYKIRKLAGCVKVNSIFRHVVSCYITAGVHKHFLIKADG